MRICPACMLPHGGMESCRSAKARLCDVVVDVPTEVVDIAPKIAASVVDTKHGVYADKEKRRAYQRNWVKKRRELKKACF